MFGIFSRPFNNLEEIDLTELVNVRRLREHVQLDYKGRTYSHGREEAVEMLADVTAMANAQGGYILIGVTEDEAEPDGTPKDLVGIEHGDEEVRWIQSVCLSSIEEKITGLQVRDIPLSNGKSCVVIQVPNSLRKPHMIVYQKHRSFRIRHGRDKGFMGMQEVRNMILSMNTYRESLGDFIEKRKQALRDYANSEPWFLLMATPIYVDTDKVDPLRQDIRELLDRTPGVPDSRYEGIRTSTLTTPRLFGVEAAYPPKRLGDRYNKILRLFHNGHFEFCEGYIGTIAPDRPNDSIPIHSHRVTVMLLHFLTVAAQVMELGEIGESIALTLHFENYNPSHLVLRQRQHVSPYQVQYWDELSLSVESIASDLSNPGAVARPMIDRLLNAFGYEVNPHFDDNNIFIVESD